MYSVVLMMSLTGGMETPDFGRRRCSGSCSGYSSCCGGSYGSCHGGRRSRGGRGCCGGGGYSCCGGGYYGGGGCCGGYAPGGMPGTPYRTPQGERVPAPKKVQAENPATVLVNLPEDATLTVGGRPTSLTSAQRRFITPPLPAEGESFYTFRAQIVRDGRTIASEQRVVVRPGEETRVNFDFAPTSVVLAP